MENGSLIRALTVYDEGSVIKNGYVRIRDGIIEEVGEGNTRLR